MSEAIDLEPSRIFSRIESCPPLMRADAASRYIGKEVFWSLSYANASQVDKNQVHLIFRSGLHDIRMVVGDVLLSSYPGLRVARVDEMFLVRGRIKEVDSLCIVLEIQDLILGKATEAAR